MHVEFGTDDLDHLEVDPRFAGGFSQGVVRGFRKAMQAIRSAVDERDLYALKGFRFEKLQGKPAHQRSLRINDQWRLVVEVREKDGKKQVWIIRIEDYH
jgi:toxin HigB-1